MNNLICELEQNNISFKINEPMKNHTSFKIGGCVDVFISPKSIEECKNAILLCKKYNINYKTIGKGSNILADDNGIKDAIILISNNLSKIKLLDDNKIYCQAGASLASVCQFALKSSLTGLEFAYGIPGNVGGAIFMNAGAYGGEMKDIVLSCEYFDENGILHSINDMDFSYRHSFFSDKNYIIFSATIKLQAGNKNAIKEKMDEILKKRKEKQPLEYPSAGSTFKRPEGNYASLLIDECGLKGMSIGGAEVSEKHAGFIINKNNATSKDVLDLIKYVQDVVFNKTGYILEPEIEII